MNPHFYRHFIFSLAPRRLVYEKFERVEPTPPSAEDRIQTIHGQAEELRGEATKGVGAWEWADLQRAENPGIQAAYIARRTAKMKFNQAKGKFGVSLYGLPAITPEAISARVDQHFKTYPYAERPGEREFLKKQMPLTLMPLKEAVDLAQKQLLQAIDDWETSQRQAILGKPEKGKKTGPETSRQLHVAKVGVEKRKLEVGAATYTRDFLQKHRFLCGTIQIPGGGSIEIRPDMPDDGLVSSVNALQRYLKNKFIEMGALSTPKTDRTYARLDDSKFGDTTLDAFHKFLPEQYALFVKPSRGKNAVV